MASPQASSQGISRVAAFVKNAMLQVSTASPTQKKNTKDNRVAPALHRPAVVRAVAVTPPPSYSLVARKPEKAGAPLLPVPQTNSPLTEIDAMISRARLRHAVDSALDEVLSHPDTPLF